MKQIGLLVAFLIIVLNSSFSQPAKLNETNIEEYSQAEKRKLHKVKRVVFKHFEDSISYLKHINFDLKKVEEYDTNGDEEKTYYVSKNDSLYLGVERKYDDEHRLIFFVEYNEKGEEGSRYQALYKDSNLVVEKRYGGDLNQDSSFLFYNEIGNLTMYVTFKYGNINNLDIYTTDIYGNPKHSESYSFQAFNRRYRFFKTWKIIDFIDYEMLSNTDYIERIYERDSTLRMKRYWKYDNQKRLLDRIEFYGQEEVSTWYSYKYDCDGNEIEVAVYDSFTKKLTFRTESMYENGLLIEEHGYDSQNKLSSIEKYYYNDKTMNYLWVYNTIEKGKSKVAFIKLMEIEYETK